MVDLISDGNTYGEAGASAGRTLDEDSTMLAFDNPLGDFKLSVPANSCQDCKDVFPDTPSFE